VASFELRQSQLNVFLCVKVNLIVLYNFVEDGLGFCNRISCSTFCCV